MDPHDSLVELELLGRLASDRASGELAPLADYLALFPGHAELVAREYERASRGGQSAPANVESGGRVGPYRLERELGRGGQAVVWLAKDEQLDRRVAVKVVVRPFTGADLSSRFKREARATAGLEHPSVCAVYDAGVDGDRAWIAMQYVEGETLGEWLARRDEERSHAIPTPTDIADACRWLEAVARALHVAHARGVVHRDVKPGNIMISNDGVPVVLDFGLATLDDDGAQLTMTGTTLGTPAYMSPEHIGAGTARVGPISDVWSLGATLYEACVGKRPFQAPTRHGLTHAILNEEPPDPRALSPHVSNDLVAILQTALDKHPERRYATAEALADDLARMTRREPISVRPLSRGQRLARWAQRNPIVASLSLLLAAVTLGGLAYVLVTNRELRDTNERVFEANRELEEKTDEAQASADLATKREAEAGAALAEYQRLADARRLKQARVESAALQPVHPDLVPGLQAWQERYERLFERTESHRRILDALREQAKPYTEEARLADYADEYDGIARIEATLPAYRETRHDEFLEQLEAFQAKIGGQRSWDFGDDLDLQFRHDALSTLIAELDEAAAVGGLRDDVMRRLDLSQRIAGETIDAHRDAWTAAAARVAASEHYAGLELAPQMGLIPLGADPVSGLEEFVHWETHTGDLPTRDDSGALGIKPTTGVVLVLIPGGDYVLGAQPFDAAKLHYDPQTRREEMKPHTLALDPYFLGKFEVTQGQWRGVTGTTPAAYFVGYILPPDVGYVINTLHPVESIRWDEAQHALHAVGLMLPTESQWEAAARAGTQARYAGTDDELELSRFANGLGVESARYFPATSPELSDGYSTHAPIGTFLPNAFGLHDMSGNVAEWVRDRFGPYAVESRPGDGERRVIGDTYVVRGGSFTSLLPLLRVSNRAQAHGPTSGVNAGVRAARKLDP